MGVVVALAPLVVRAGFFPPGDGIGEALPDKPRRHKAPRNQAPREMLCKCKKCLFGILLGGWNKKLAWKHCQPGVERLLVGKQV
jgi:hypothetical protein